MHQRILIAGSSGFLGSHLAAELTRRGHDVRRLVRREAAAPEESSWDPYAGRVDDAEVAAADVVINLAGAPTLGNPHSKAWARELVRSRLTSTALLAERIAATAKPPAYLAGNGISYYGDHGAEVLTEVSDSRGHALLTELTRDWEAAASPAARAGSRVCILRTAPVMDVRNPPMKQFRTLFRSGLGGRVGSGQQYMPMITLRDWVGAVAYLAEHDTASGPFNLCLPVAPTNIEFAETMARALHRKAFLPAPKFAVKALSGPMAPEALASMNTRPAALLSAGYVFADDDVVDLVATALNPADS